MIALKSALKGSQPFLFVIASFIFFGLSLQTKAGDYDLAYAIDALGQTEDGTSTECTYNSPCRLTLEKSRISITIFSDRYLQHIFTVYIDTVDLALHRYGCCYFYDADNFVRVDAAKPFHRLGIFVGRRRKGDEHVINKKIGELYLEFRNLKPSPRPDPRHFSLPPYRT